MKKTHVVFAALLLASFTTYGILDVTLTNSDHAVRESIAKTADPPTLPPPPLPRA
jgi:hypothetical protein